MARMRPVAVVAVFVRFVLMVQAPWGYVVRKDRDTFHDTTAPTACMDSFGGRGGFVVLTLHSWSTVSEAVTAFGGNGTAEAFCDGQFVVLPSVGLCFITVGETFDEPHVPSPSEVVWRPKLGTKRTGPDDDDWLPEKVREVWDRSGKELRKLRDHHILVRTPADDRFFYAGEG